MELRWYVKYYYTGDDKLGQTVNSIRTLQFRPDALTPWADVPAFDDTPARDSLEVAKKLPIDPVVIADPVADVGKG